MQQYFIDDLGNAMNISFPPKKIVSLVPSQTELLFQLGLQDKIAGITKFCIHPENKVKTIRKIGGTKTVNIEAIQKIEPDIIIANKEENNQLQIALLQQYFPVWVSNIINLNDALLMIDNIGKLTDTLLKAKQIQTHILNAYENLHPFNKSNNSVAYLIWRKPYMSVNKDTFIHDMLMRCGFQNVFASTTERYPVVSIDMLKSARPDYIFLSSEPYPFVKKHIDELLQHNIVMYENQIQLVDGEMFSWYGSRLIQAANYFNSLISEL